MLRRRTNRYGIILHVRYKQIPQTKALKLAISLNQSLAAELDVEALLQKSVDEIVDKLGLLGGLIFLVKDDRIYAQSIAGGRLAKKFTSLIGVPISNLYIHIDHPSNLVARCVRDKKPYYSNELYDFTVGVLNKMQTTIAQSITGTGSAAVLPLVNPRGVVGALYISSEDEQLLMDIQPVIELITTGLAIAVSNSLLFQEVNESHAKVTAALRELNRLRRTEKERVSILVHNMKNNLTALLVATDLLKHSVIKPENKELLAISEESLNQILNTLDNAFIDIRSEKEESVYEEEMEVHQLLQESTQLFASSAKVKGLQYEVQNDVDHKIKITSDRLKLNQIFENIISNSIKYTREGKVHIHAYIEEGSLIVKVKDTGIGIHQDEIDKIGKKFFRSEKSFNATRNDDQEIPDGSGLGVYATRKYLNLIGGDLSYQSKLGEGTEATITLPLHSSD